MIGHSYFMDTREESKKSKEDAEEYLNKKLNYQVIPLLEEYVKDGILRPKAKEEIEKLKIIYG